MSSKSESMTKSVSGLQKAALLMIALDVDTAAEVFKYLDPAEIEGISAEITQVRNTPSQTVDIVMERISRNGNCP